MVGVRGLVLAVVYSGIVAEGLLLPVVWVLVVCTAPTTLSVDSCGMADDAVDSCGMADDAVDSCGMADDAVDSCGAVV